MGIHKEKTEEFTELVRTVSATIPDSLHDAILPTQGLLQKATGGVHPEYNLHQFKHRKRDRHEEDFEDRECSGNEPSNLKMKKRTKEMDEAATGNVCKRSAANEDTQVRPSKAVSQQFAREDQVHSRGQVPTEAVVLDKISLKEVDWSELEVTMETKFDVDRILADMEVWKWRNGLYDHMDSRII